MPRRLSGDYDGNEYLKEIKEEPSYIDGTAGTVRGMKKTKIRRDGNFYGHLKSGSIKKGIVKGESC